MINPKILICADKEAIRESLKLALGDQYNFVMVDTIDMAKEVLSHCKEIKLMLSNIKIPKTNGLDVKTIMVDGLKSIESAAQAARLAVSD